MCYEFVHPCDSLLIRQIVHLAGADACFMFCIGHLNYLYCVEASSVLKIRNFLTEMGIALHRLSEKEMESVINHPSIQEWKTFHGSQDLFDMFSARTQAA